MSPAGGLARYGPNGTAHALLGAQIAHLLRLRVLQELAALTLDLRCRPQSAAAAPVLRRLTRAELADVRAGGALPGGALALLVVPPVNRDARTKTRPPAQMDERPLSPEQAAQEAAAPPPKRAPLPLSVLLPAEPHTELADDVGALGVLPAHAGHCVPLYNGVTLFSSRSQRAALHKALCNLLFVERRARWREEGRSASVGKVAKEDTKEDKWARGDKKASHAFVLCSDSDTIGRADAVPLAIALWRLRMWEGDAWGGNAQPWDVTVS